MSDPSACGPLRRAVSERSGWCVRRLLGRRSLDAHLAIQLGQDGVVPDQGPHQLGEGEGPEFEGLEYQVRDGAVRLELLQQVSGLVQALLRVGAGRQGLDRRCPLGLLFVGAGFGRRLPGASPLSWRICRAGVERSSSACRSPVSPDGRN
jgi:hypothetical protein